MTGGIERTRFGGRRAAARSAVLLVAVLACLTGCTAPTPTPTGGSIPTATADSAPTVTDAPSASPVTSPTGGASDASSSATGVASDPDRPSGQCADSALTVSLSMPEGAAGSFEQDIVFTNTGSSTCVLRGAPGLSVVGGGTGTQLGAAAARDQSGAKDVRLSAQGGQAYAPFGGPELGPGTEGAKQCAAGVRSADGYRVYPPHSTRASFVRDSDAVACPTGGAFLHVGVVLPEGTAG